MSKKTADLSGILAPKGQASSANSYPGDEPQTAVKPTVKTRAKASVQNRDIPAHLRIEKPEPRRDALNIRITASERERIEALCDRYGYTITEVLTLGLGSLERELNG